MYLPFTNLLALSSTDNFLLASLTFTVTSTVYLVMVLARAVAGSITAEGVLSLEVNHILPVLLAAIYTEVC